MNKEDFLTILACLESKELNVRGRLDPRVPRDEDGKSIFTVDVMLKNIERIRKEIRSKI